MKLKLLMLALPRTSFMLLLTGMALLGLEPVAGRASARPTAPAQLSGVAVSVQQVRLTWAAPDPAAGIERYSIRRNGDWLATIRAESPAYDDLNIQASTTYSYTIRAIGAGDDASAASNVALVRVPSLPETTDVAPPSAPTTLTATALPGGVLLDWYDASDDSDITVYLIRRDGIALALVPSGTRSYTDPLPPAAGIYTVEALDVLGHHSAPSNTATAAQPSVQIPLIRHHL